MKRLLIIGAGGFGREVLRWALDLPSVSRDWEVGGFLDANPKALAGYVCPYPVLADPITYRPETTDRFVCAIGKPSAKMALCNALNKRGAEFISLIHPTAIIGDQCTIGKGCIICPGVVITTDVSIGNFVTINLHSTIGHDAVIGDGCTLSAHVDITGFASLGQCVFLGSHASILPSAKVGNFAVVGAGSVVLKRVKPGVTVMGVPTKQIAGF
ncbi:acetyltransferase [Verrucomicrobiota bacterium]